MNNIETSANKQYFAVGSIERLIQDLRHAIKTINAEYQQIDWEDQAFLNRVLSEAITTLNKKEVV
jgi:hypothetical protein